MPCSLTYDWDPVILDLDVMGHPRVRLTVTSPVPVAYISAKLCDVFPDGTSALAGRGLLNLTHRNGHDAPLALEPGVPTRIEIELEATSWIFEPGHCVRLSLAGADWPNIWPPPSGEPLQVDRASVELVLPVLDGPSPLPAPVLPPTTGKDTHAPDADDEQPPTVWRLEDDQIGHEARCVTGSGSNYEAPFGARVEERYEGTTGVSKDDPGARLGTWAHHVPDHLARGGRAHGGDAGRALRRRGVPRRHHAGRRGARAPRPGRAASTGSGAGSGCFRGVLA